MFFNFVRLDKAKAGKKVRIQNLD